VAVGGDCRCGNWCYFRLRHASPDYS
jgi:hypothetical protein